MKKVIQVITPLKKSNSYERTGLLRVAAYARVSIDSNEQINSLISSMDK